MGTLFFGLEMEKAKKDKTLEDLQREIFDITGKQNLVQNWGLSKEVEFKVISELQEQKTEIIKLMHEKVDQL
jgi:hypothetical protein